jgi:lysophospholipase L1-like esterase
MTAILRAGLPAVALGVLTIAGAPAATSVRAQAAQAAPHRFEDNVRAYEDADKTDPPPAHAILLAGDSQFYRWKTLHEDLPDYTIVNRGIDSFQTSDLIYFADRLILRYAPRMIVLHVGGNDVNNGKTPDQILADFKTLVAKVRTTLPGRWTQAAQRKQTNLAVKDYVATQKGLLFIDLWDAMLTPDGQPREDIWVADRVHPNHEGYLIRVRIMRPLLGPPDRPAAR